MMGFLWLSCTRYHLQRVLENPGQHLARQLYNDYTGKTNIIQQKVMVQVWSPVVLQTHYALDKN